MSAFYQTTNGDLAAILMALGCDPLEGAECSNTYTEDKPWREGRPGKVVWSVEMASSTADVGAEEIAKGFNDDGVLLEEFDAMVEKIEDEKLRAAIKERVPQVIASFARACFTNRRRIATWWKDVPAYVLIHKNGKTYLLNREAKQLRKKWNL